MNAAELLEKGNLMVIQTVEGIPEDVWDTPGACGEWSIKDIIAHLTSYERMAVEVFNAVLSGKEPPASTIAFLRQFDIGHTGAVEALKYHTAQQVIDEYQDIQVQATSLFQQLPAALAQQRGAMPWYDRNASLADYVTELYEHTREHCRQIALFYDRIKQELEKDEP